MKELSLKCKHKLLCVFNYPVSDIFLFSSGINLANSLTLYVEGSDVPGHVAMEKQ